MLLIWCVHSACDPIFGQRPTINSLYVQLWLRTYMCSTTKSQLHLTWLEVWWSLGSYPSIFHHAMRGDTLSHSIETIIWLMMIIWSDPSMFHDAVSPWSLHIYHYEAMQGQGPHFPPTRKATIHIHRGEGGKGVKMGTLHWGGVGGGLAKPGSYMICNYLTLNQINNKSINSLKHICNCVHRYLSTMIWLACISQKRKHVFL